MQPKFSFAEFQGANYNSSILTDYTLGQSSLALTPVENILLLTLLVSSGIQLQILDSINTIKTSNLHWVKVKFYIKNFFSKCDQIRMPFLYPLFRKNLEEILLKLQMLCSYRIAIPLKGCTTYFTRYLKFCKKRSDWFRTCGKAFQEKYCFLWGYCK